ncbi:MAG TPA: phosphatase PAP2 family protein [Sphingobacteriaceae bacterium]
MISTLHKKTRKFLAGLLLLTSETIVSLVLFVAAVVVFVFIAKSVFWDQKAEFDAAVFLFFERFVNERNTGLVSVMTGLGNYQFLVPANLVLIFYYLVIRRHRWYSIKIPAVAFGSLAIMFLLKWWFSRPRPLSPLLGPALGYSFPSGHATSSVTFFGLLIYFLWKKKTLAPAVRYVLILLLVLLILLIGISRVYLRVHYASDVVAGYCVGVIWLVFSIHLLDRIERRGRKKLEPMVENR